MKTQILNWASTIVRILLLLTAANYLFLLIEPSPWPANLQSSLSMLPWFCALAMLLLLATSPGDKRNQEETPL